MKNLCSSVFICGLLLIGGAGVSPAYPAPIDLGLAPVSVVPGDRVDITSSVTRPSIDTAAIWRLLVPPQLQVLGITGTLHVIVGPAQLNWWDALGAPHTELSDTCDLYIQGEPLAIQPEANGLLRLDLRQSVAPGATTTITVHTTVVSP